MYWEEAKIKKGTVGQFPKTSFSICELSLPAISCPVCRFRRIYNALGENSLADNFLWKWEIHFKWIMCVCWREILPLTKELKLCPPRKKKFGQSEIFSATALTWFLTLANDSNNSQKFSISIWRIPSEIEVATRYKLLTLHYAARAVNLGKSNHEIELIANWILCQFSSNTCFFGWGSLNFPIREHEGGVFHRRNWSQKFCFYKCYDICFCNFCEKKPLHGKNAS